VLLLAVALFGSALIPVLALQPNLEQQGFSLRLPLIGGLYVGICLLGVLAVFYPSKCRGVFQKSQNVLQKTEKPCLQINGHHPDCYKYEANRIKIQGKVFCAACSGLLAGSVVALVGAVSYFFAGVGLKMDNIWLLILGEALMILGIIQIRLASYAKLTVNMVFVSSSLLVLVETDFLMESILVDLYALGLIAFILLLRILFSEWNNKRTCMMCNIDQ
jgi:hypothetical protein